MFKDAIDFNKTKFVIMLLGTEWPRRADVPLNHIKIELPSLVVPHAEEAAVLESLNSNMVIIRALEMLG